MGLAYHLPVRQLRDLALLAMALAVAVVCVLTVTRDQDADVSNAPPLKVAPPRESTVVVVMGDSYSGGSDMNAGPEWPQQVTGPNDWILGNMSIGGSGYVAGGQIQEPLTARVDHLYQDYTPDVLVLAAGFNDAGQYSDDRIATAAREVIETARTEGDATVVMLSPFATNNVSAETTALAGALREVAEETDTPYLDVTQILAGQPDLIGTDRTHPTDAGHARIARFIGPWLIRQVDSL